MPCCVCRINESLIRPPTMTSATTAATNPLLYKVSWRYEGEAGVEEFKTFDEMEKWIEIHSHYQDMTFYS